MVTVFTNGCFDILHAGHVRLLEWAKTRGDCLIVGLNSDDSVRRLKGSDRPIMKEQDRFLILSSLRCVNRVIIFEEDTPLELMQRIRPQILVKGPECRGQTVPGQEFIQSIGGRVDIPDWPVDISTTKILSRIRGDYDNDSGRHYRR